MIVNIIILILKTYLATGHEDIFAGAYIGTQASGFSLF